MTAPEIVVEPDDATLARTVAAALLDLIEHAQVAGEVPGIGLTGGTIADAIHREVARQTVSRNIDWRRVELRPEGGKPGLLVGGKRRRSVRLPGRVAKQ